MTRPIFTDIEGITTPVSFVAEVLSPYARRRLPASVREGTPTGPAAARRQARGFDGVHP
jgi:methionine salvage enolase-phosphatase E1